MAKSTETIAKETRKVRFRLHALVQGGMTLQEALVKILPTDSNRSKKLKTWQRMGLYPVNSEELRIFGNQTETPRTSTLPVSTSSPIGVLVETTSQPVPPEEPISEMGGTCTSEEAETPLRQPSRAGD